MRWALLPTWALVKLHDFYNERADQLSNLPEFFNSSKLQIKFDKAANKAASIYWTINKRHKDN